MSAFGQSEQNSKELNLQTEIFTKKLRKREASIMRGIIDAFAFHAFMCLFYFELINCILKVYRQTL